MCCSGACYDRSGADQKGRPYCEKPSTARGDSRYTLCMPRATRVPAFTLRQLVAFLAVSERGTLSAAAESLHVSASAVSLAISELEKAIGAVLCVRQRAHGVQLTVAGTALLPHVRALVEQALELQALEGHAQPGMVTGRVSLGCYASLGPTILPPMFDDFRSLQPGVEVETHEDEQTVLIGELRRGLLDSMITYDLDLPSEWPRFTLLSRTPMVLLPTSHRLNSVEGPIPLKVLAREPLVVLDTSPSREHQLAVCARAGFTPNVALMSRNFETVRSFVGRGRGWALMLQRPAIDRTYEGLPVTMKDFEGATEQAVDIVLAWQRGPLSRGARAFIDFVRERVKVDRNRSGRVEAQGAGIIRNGAADGPR